MIVSHDRVHAEFDRLKAGPHKFSEAEMHALVAAVLALPVEAVAEVLAHKEAA